MYDGGSPGSPGSLEACIGLAWSPVAAYLTYTARQRNERSRTLTMPGTRGAFGMCQELERTVSLGPALRSWVHKQSRCRACRTYVRTSVPEYPGLCVTVSSDIGWPGWGGEERRPNLNGRSDVRRKCDSQLLSARGAGLTQLTSSEKEGLRDPKEARRPRGRNITMRTMDHPCAALPRPAQV